MYPCILVPIDGSETAERGLNEAISLAGELGASLVALNVVDARMLLGFSSGYATPEEWFEHWQAQGQMLVDRAVERAQARGVKARGKVRFDPGLRTCDHIVKEAQESGAGLIVMGTHGRKGVRRVALGSDAEFVLRESPVPVLMVRPEASAK